MVVPCSRPSRVPLDGHLTFASPEAFIALQQSFCDGTSKGWPWQFPWLGGELT